MTISGARIPFLDLKDQYLEIRDEIDAAVLRAVGSGWYVLGSECESFERAFKEYLVGEENGYVVAVNSGTDALRLSLLAGGIGAGDRVITAANTAIPTAAAIRSVGAVPVFCDVDPKTWLLDPAQVAKRITRKTRAIVPVHLYGASCDMDPIRDAAGRRRLVIEDAAQATGAEYRGRKCGTIGNFGSFSFYPSKNLGACGDGGAVFVRSRKDRDLLSRLRNYGQRTRYRADTAFGMNSRLDEVQAAILSVKLRHLEAWNRTRRELAASYRMRIAAHGIPVAVQEEYEGASSANHLFVVKTRPSIRDAVMERLSSGGIQTLVHYPRTLDRQPAFSAFRKHPNPVSEELCSSVISLPFHPYLKEADVGRIVERLGEAVREFPGRAPGMRRNRRGRADKP